MITPTRTPEGIPDQCPICGHRFNAVPSQPTGDVPCPRCGHLIWPVGTEVGVKRLESTKRAIRQLAGEIERTAKDSPTQLQMAEILLQNVITALAAVGGSITTMRQSDSFLIWLVNRSVYPDPSHERFVHFRNRALIHTWKTNTVNSYLPMEGPEDTQNTTDYLMIYTPIKHPDDEFPSAVLEIVQRANAGLASQRGYKKFTTEMCCTVGKHIRFKITENEHADPRKSKSSLFSNFASKISTSLAKWRQKLTNFLTTNP